MENQVEEIKKKLDIVEIINRYLPLKKRGRHYLACCPFHGEKTPSFTVSPELQIFKCFGCGKAGDVFTFVQEYEHVEFREALEELAKIAGITLIKNINVTQEELQKKMLVEINHEVARFYNYILTSHALGNTALEYVKNRGITLETIKKFNIGFAPANSQLLVNYLFKKGYKSSQLIPTGTFAQNKYGASSLYDRFQSRLVFPLYDYRDRVLGFSGRVMSNSPNSANSAKYINSPETEIYHKGQMVYGLNFAKEAIRVNNSVIVVEGEFDMISPYQAGIQNIVALKGTAFTPEQLQLLRRYTDTLILALDSDFAGNNAAKKSIELADSLEFDIKVLTLGDYKDPDEAVKSDLPFFQNQLKNTIPVWDFLIESMVKMHDPDTIKGKKEILSNILPFLVKINNSVIRSDYIKKLANEIGSNEEAVFQEIAKYSPVKSASPGGYISASPPPKEETVNSPTEKFEEMLLILIFGAKKPAVLSRKLKEHLNSFSSPKLKIFADKLLLTTDFDPKIFQEELPAEYRSIFQNLFLEATSLAVESTKRLSEIKKTINQIGITNLKNQLTELSFKINHLEAAHQKEDLHQVELEYNQLLLKLSRLQTKKR